MTAPEGRLVGLSFSPTFVVSVGTPKTMVEGSDETGEDWNGDAREKSGTCVVTVGGCIEKGREGCIVKEGIEAGTAVGGLG